MTRTAPEPADPPLGASWDGSATTFRIFSDNATSIELVLEDAGTPRLPMARDGGGTWQLRTALARPGTRYGFRACGPGTRMRVTCSIPPSSSSIRTRAPSTARCGGTRALRIAPARIRAQSAACPIGRIRRAHLPRSVVVADDFDWQGDRRPEVPWSRQRDLRVPREGHDGAASGRSGVSCAAPGSALPPTDHRAPQRRLGVTAVELLPVQPAADSALAGAQRPHQLLGLRHDRLLRARSSLRERRRARASHEFREMVRRLHAAGIEVLLDVVYNHTGEGGLRRTDGVVPRTRQRQLLPPAA